jgi:hypothetical protein
LSDSLVSELYVPIFQNTLFHLHRWCTLKLPLTPPMKMEQTECSRMWAHKIQTLRNHPKEITQLSTFQWPPSSESRKSKKNSHMHYTDPADGGNKLLQNARNYLPMDMGSYPIKPCLP